MTNESSKFTNLSNFVFYSIQNIIFQLADKYLNCIKKNICIKRDKRKYYLYITFFTYN